MDEMVSTLPRRCGKKKKSEEAWTQKNTKVVRTPVYKIIWEGIL